MIEYIESYDLTGYKDKEKLCFSRDGEVREHFLKHRETWHKSFDFLVIKKIIFFRNYAKNLKI